MHARDLHQFRKLTYCLDIDTNATVRDGDCNKFSAMTDAETQVLCYCPVTSRIERTLSALFSDQGDVLRTAIKVLT